MPALTHYPISALAAALLDPLAPAPTALRTCNASDPSARLAVYRNNVMHSLTAVLGDTFPVVRQWVGDEFFTAMAGVFVRAHPPRSPLMHQYGDGFAAWLATFAPAQDLPYLPDLARLEFARWQALHAADINPLPAQALADALGDADQVARLRLTLHPCLTVIESAYAVVAVWQAHQGDEAARDAALQTLDVAESQSALVFRSGDDALVLPMRPADAALTAALHGGESLASASAAHAHANLPDVLGTLLAHELITAVQVADTAAPVFTEALS